MKLQLPAIVVFLFVPGRWRTPLPVSAALWLRPQKNQPHWLACSTSSSETFPLPVLFPPAPQFHSPLLPPT